MRVLSHRRPIGIGAEPSPCPLPLSTAGEGSPCATSRWSLDIGHLLVIGIWSLVIPRVGHSDLVIGHSRALVVSSFDPTVRSLYNTGIMCAMSYQSAGVDYDPLDAFKRLCQAA